MRRHPPEREGAFFVSAVMSFAQMRSMRFADDWQTGYLEGGMPCVCDQKPGLR